MTHQRVLITGASNGFGRLSSETLVRKGHTVFATMRDLTGKNAAAAAELKQLAEQTDGTLHALELDVLSDDSVNNAVEQSIRLAGGIDVVVNNAGFGCGGWSEGFTPQQLEQLFAVNLVGVHRVNRAVLPHLRERRTGLLLHISSIMGRVVIPFAAPYTASKYALEGLVESYRYELANFGVDVAILEPGGYGTSFAANMVPPADEPRIAGYGELAGLPEQAWSGFLEQLQSADAPDPREVADAVAQLVETPQGQRPLRTIVDSMTGGAGADKINALTDEVQAQLIQSMQQ